MTEVAFVQSLHAAWSKCCFCGASNGHFDAPLQQHRTRCRYKGPADTFEWAVPNYAAMIAEDDAHFLAMMHAEAENPKLRARIRVLELTQAKRDD
jgi:hypothetical protein